MSAKDPFQILADELTLIRKDMDQLQRTSLSKDEAKALSQEVAKGLSQMARTGEAVQQAMDTRLSAVATDLRTSTVKAAQDAARGAIEQSHAEVLAAAGTFAKAAGEARRAAWRSFGGFWVWLTAMLALGGLAGALASVWITGRGDANAFGKFPGVYCASAGGQVVKQDNGSSFCAIWIDRPSKVGK